MDRKIILSLQGNALIAFAAIFALPIFYAAISQRDVRSIATFAALGISVALTGRLFLHLGRKHKRRLLLVESAFAILLTYPLLAIFGAVPFWLSGFLSPLDATLETVSDLTSAGISLLPNTAPFILKLWQGLLMWFGSLIFLVILVTVMPEVSGCFGMDLSLHGGQNFSPIFGQMFLMANRILKVYAGLTLLSFALFKMAGLDFWDALSMAMRCISTGGGNFLPEKINVFVEGAAALTMLMACGNFLFYHRLIVTLPPQLPSQQENIFRRGIRYINQLEKNFVSNVRKFFSNSEIKAVALIIFLGVGIIAVSTYRRGVIDDGGAAFWYAFLNVVSFLSTTGINFAALENAPDFDRFFVFLMAVFGGCIGSVTGGLKIVRVLILAKITAAELTKTIHPRMIVSVRINKISVPPKIVGRILGFFFLAVLTLFICSAILSFTGPTFSQAVAISVACLTNVGSLPGICDAEVFLNLAAAGKIFCVAVLIVGRLEIFALLITVAGLTSRQNFKEW